MQIDSTSMLIINERSYNLQPASSVAQKNSSHRASIKDDERSSLSQQCSTEQVSVLPLESLRMPQHKVLKKVNEEMKYVSIKDEDQLSEESKQKKIRQIKNVAFRLAKTRYVSEQKLRSPFQQTKFLQREKRFNKVHIMHDILGRISSDRIASMSKKFKRTDQKLHEQDQKKFKRIKEKPNENAEIIKQNIMQKIAQNNQKFAHLSKISEIDQGQKLFTMIVKQPIRIQQKKSKEDSPIESQIIN